MKNQKFNFDGKSFEIYNECGTNVYYVQLKKNGQRSSPNAKTLGMLTKRMFDFGIKNNAITLIK